MLSDYFPGSVYFLCFLASSACAWLLARNYRRRRARLLFWSALCFCLLALNNLVVVIDLAILVNWDLGMVRRGLSLAAVGTLLFGFIWDLEE